MHVSVIMTSYAALIIGSIISFAIFFTDKQSELQIRTNSMGIGSFHQKISSSSSKFNEESFQLFEHNFF